MNSYKFFIEFHAIFISLIECVESLLALGAIAKLISICVGEARIVQRSLCRDHADITQ